MLTRPTCSSCHPQDLRGSGLNMLQVEFFVNYFTQAFLVEATQGVALRTFYVSEFPQAALKQGGNGSPLPCFNPLLAVNAACCTC